MAGLGVGDSLSHLSNFQGPPQSALARLATWRDLGAGIGPLIAGALLPIVPSSLLYGAAALGLAASALSLHMVRGKG